MRTIWKWELEITDRQVISMPRDANALTVQIQNGKPCLWALVSPDCAKRDVPILIFGTGHPVQNDGHYIGTVQVGALVFHVFAEQVSGKG